MTDLLADDLFDDNVDLSSFGFNESLLNERLSSARRDDALAAASRTPRRRERIPSESFRPSSPAPSTSGGGSFRPPSRNSRRMGDSADPTPLPVEQRVTYNITFGSVGNPGGRCCQGRSPAADRSCKSCEDIAGQRAQMRRQYQLLQKALRPIVSQLQGNHDPNVAFLQRFIRGSDIHGILDAELTARDRRGTVPVVVDSGVDGKSTFDLDLVGGTVDEKLLSAIRHVADLYSYESRQWQTVFKEYGPRGRQLDGLALEDIIKEQGRVVQKPFSATVSLLTAAKAYIDRIPNADPDLLTVERYLDNAVQVLETERGLAVQKLAEIEILKRSP